MLSIAGDVSLKRDSTKHNVKGNLIRFLHGIGAQLSGRGPRNRRKLYPDTRGLRMVTLHETRGTEQMDRLKRLVDYCEQHFDWGAPDDIIALCDGRFVPRARDTLLLTFDDGHCDNFDAASYLASKGIPALFFVIPAFLERDVQAYYEFHKANGIQAFRFAPHHTESRGLSRSQIREMRAMGHLIGGHNYAHRNLGFLHEARDLEYEIRRALDDLGEILGQPCQDFAHGFGQPEHLSVEAFAYLNENCARLYSSVRGLNIPGQSPRLLLRDPVNLWHPFVFTTATLNGALDHRALNKRTALEKLGGRLPEAAAGSEVRAAGELSMGSEGSG
jgi:peptidoglycan/xylan/chitin deacetylase (PgdA/CDA1 family)